MCTATTDVATVLEADAHAPHEARQLLARVACATHNASVLDTAQLLVSELVTDALQHGRPPITLHISCVEEAGLQIELTDTAPGLPVLREHDLAAAHGRGIALVDMLSDDWGIRPGDQGKRIWFRLRQPT
jgi:anti-sigma regulatory factor (Ser/Thr protein kinase)